MFGFQACMDLLVETIYCERYLSNLLLIVIVTDSFFNEEIEVFLHLFSFTLYGVENTLIQAKKVQWPRLETRTKEFSVYASHWVLRNLKAK